MLASITPSSSVASWISSRMDDFKGLLEENKNLLWIVPSISLPLYLGTWRLFKAGLSYSLKRTAEEKCGLFIPYGKWSEFARQYRIPGNGLPFAEKTSGNFLSALKNFAVSVWHLKFKLMHIANYLAQEAEYLVGGTALELGAGYMAGRILDVNPTIPALLSVLAGFGAAQYRRAYVFNYFRKDLKLFGHPTPEFCRTLEEFIHEYVSAADGAPMPVKVPVQAPAAASRPAILSPSPAFYPAFDVSSSSQKAIEKGAKVTTVGIAGTIAVLAILESLAASVAMALGVFVPAGFEEELNRPYNGGDIL